LEQSRSQVPKLKVSIDELQLERTSLKIQTIVIVDACTACALGKVIWCDFKQGSVERSIDR
jgi:hypothetical protein